MALLSNNSASSEDRLTIVCLYCDKPQEISRRARSVTCKFCYKPLKLEDITIKAYEARRVIETVGIVTVEKKGRVFSDRIHCGGLVVRGAVKGHVTSRGPVLVGPDAEIKGDVEAPTLAVGAGAVLEGYFRIGQITKLPPEMAAESPATATKVVPREKMTR